MGMTVSSRYRVVLAICLVLFSCGPIRWVENAPRELDAQAKTFKTSPASANLYVIYQGSAWSYHAIFLDGVEAAVLNRRRYRVFDVSPGRHDVGEGWQTARRTIAVTAEAGRNYFVLITESGSTWYRPGSYSIEIVDEAQGRQLVLESRLSGRFKSLSGELRSSKE